MTSAILLAQLCDFLQQDEENRDEHLLLQIQLNL